MNRSGWEGGGAPMCGRCADAVNIPLQSGYGTMSCSICQGPTGRRAMSWLGGAWVSPLTPARSEAETLRSELAAAYALIETLKNDIHFRSSR